MKKNRIEPKITPHDCILKKLPPQIRRRGIHLLKFTSDRNLLLYLQIRKGKRADLAFRAYLVCVADVTSELGSLGETFPVDKTAGPAWSLADMPKVLERIRRKLATPIGLAVPHRR